MGCNGIVQDNCVYKHACVKSLRTREQKAPPPACGGYRLDHVFHHDGLGFGAGGGLAEEGFGGAAGLAAKFGDGDGFPEGAAQEGAEGEEDF